MNDQITKWCNKGQKDKKDVSVSFSSLQPTEVNRSDILNGMSLDKTQDPLRQEEQLRPIQLLWENRPEI